MKKVNIAFGIHNHQPVGNFDFVFEEAFQKAYLPFLELLEKHPKVRVAQHYTGILLQWLLEHKPEFGPRLEKLVVSGQVEMMTGGYYEPIMSVIPDRDKVGQIRKLTEFVKQQTGYETRGMWLAERIWEPHLPKPFAEAGVRYVVLDDSHFRNAGLKEDQLHGYFITEEQGRSVFLFPVSEKLRYTIPFQPHENTLDYLRSVATEDGEALVIFADDGEKFGIWPGTYEHCYQEGWLEKFFTLLEENSDWINIVHMSEAIRNLRPSGRIYLPTASYREMMEWAMPTQAIFEYDQFEKTLKEQNLHERYNVFVRGGFWRNFMVKYPESNNMHKKMLRLSKRLAGLETDFGTTPEFKKAQDHVWASQCNCPYWHGVFGGLYLNHLRYATYNQLILAERILDRLEHPGPSTNTNGNWLQVSQEDFDADGFDEILVATETMNLYLSPVQGGSLYELDFKPRAINLLDTMTRREESYHQKLREAACVKQSLHQPDGATPDGGGIPSIHNIVVTKEEGLEKLLVYDWYRRASLVDHFLGEGTTLTDFSRCQFEELGDFVASRYEPNVRRAGKEVHIHLSRLGRVMTSEGALPVEIRKSLVVEAGSNVVRFTYEVTNRGQHDVALWFGTEMNFSLLAGDAPDRYYVIPGIELDDVRLRSSGCAAGNETKLVDEWLKLQIELEMENETQFWRFPIETVSQSEGGFERVYQSSVVFPNWRFSLASGADWGTSFVLKLECL